ncbi:MAG: hypothetical protein WBM02_02810 [bacterium]
MNKAITADRFRRPVKSCIALLVLFIGLGAYYILYGRVFLDAGFYLNAAREICAGHMPYRDFFYVQGPVYPYIYGPILNVFGFSVLNARILSLIFGLSALVLAGMTAFRSGGRMGALIALAALATVPSHAYYFSSVKLYSLSAFFLTAAFYILSSRKSLVLRHTFGLILALLAAAVRLTLAPAVLVVVVYIVYESFVLRRIFPWAAILTTSIIALGLALPFLIADAEAVIYYLIGIHTSAEEGVYFFSFAKQLKVLIKIALLYPIVTLGILFIIIKLFDRNHRKSLKRLDLAMIFSVLAVTTAHLTANWFSVGYQSVVMPLTAALVGGLSGRWITEKRFMKSGVVIGIGLIAVSCFYSWREPVWSGESVPAWLDNVAREIESRTEPGSSVAACSSVFALQANRPITAGFGGAPFTYAPHWSDDQCRRFGCLNNRLLIDCMNKKEAGLLLFESDSFTVGFPGFYPVDQQLQNDIFKAIDENYQKTLVLPSLGDGSPKLVLYVPRKDEN